MTTDPLRRLFLALLCLFSTFSVSGRVLDNFDDGNRADWQDFTFVPGFGLPTETGGQLKFALPPAGQSLFVATTKTSDTFTIADGITVEFRVDLVSGNGPDSFAVLAFIPTTSSASTLQGYGFAKSTTDILITKAADKYFYADDPAEPIKNDNVTLVLSLTGKGSDIIINAKVLDKDNNNAVIFDRTIVDTPNPELLSDGTDDPPAPFFGAGRFVLYCFEDFDEDAPQDVYEVIYDNAEVFVLENTLVDDFNDNTKTDWQDFTFVPGFGLPVETDRQYKFELPPAGTPLFVASTKTSRTFDLKEGERVQFQVDLVTGYEQDSFAILAFIPTTSQANRLEGYGFAKSTTDILITKAADKYFYADDPAEAIKNENVILQLTLEARDGSVIINGRVLDKDNNNAVIFDKTVIDTPTADVLSDGNDDPAAPYIGSGRFVLYCYEDFDEEAPQDVYRVIYDNAMAAAPPPPANLPPVISDVSPGPFANFLPASTQISFKVTDDQEVANDKIKVTLNGQTFTAANGLNISGTGNSRTVTLGGLEANKNYTAKLEASDAGNSSTAVELFFDTFSASNLTIEIEDFNFGSGQFIDNPVPIAEGFGPDPTGYANQDGMENVDYSDTRTNFDDVPYRPDDHVRMRRSLDVIRQKFVDQGGSAGGVFDYDVGDIEPGEWLNYTRTFPSGSYEVYLREALYNGTQIETALEGVTGDRTQPTQTTRPLGRFITPKTGFLLKNVPLTDARGQRVVLRLSGERTLKLVQVSGDPEDGGIFQNYMIFIPVPDAGILRATVSSVSPANGATIETFTPTINAVIQNRDTSIKAGSIKMFVNGSQVNAAIGTLPTGSDVSYTLPTIPPSGSTITAKLEFEDNENTPISTEWSFTVVYKSLNPANRVAGTGQDRGFNIRVVQAPQGSNLADSLIRAEEQLSPNSNIPEFVDTTTTTQVVNFDELGNTRGYFPNDAVIPGIEPDVNGTEDYTVEMTGYLELPAGIYRFGVVTDDGYKINSGSSFTDINAAPLGFASGNTANETFEFYVPESGLYPFRMIWYERQGDGHGEWFSINREAGDRTLINDPDSPNAIKAYRTIAAPVLQVVSSAVVTGPYQVDATANVNTSTKTVTVPFAGGTRFFQISAGTQQRIKSPRISGSNFVFEYE